jgi:hypothetical protein
MTNFFVILHNIIVEPVSKAVISELQFVGIKEPNENKCPKFWKGGLAF